MDTQTIYSARFAAYTRLIESGMWEISARKLVSKVCKVDPQNSLIDSRCFYRQLHSQLASEIKICAPTGRPTGRCQVWAIVAAPRTGATTVVAKLGARYRLYNQCRVALIAIGKNHRLLKMYADAIDLPLETVDGPEQLKAAVQQFRDQDLVLIDASGVDPQNEFAMDDLAITLNVPIDDTFVVFRCTDSLKSISASTASFARFNARASIATRMDEISENGRLFEVFRQAQLPVSYFTASDEVSKTIQMADRQEFADRILENW
ncbi:MAG: hypothetical protein N2C12_18315 [Planctomycetales bacterium]